VPGSKITTSSPITGRVSELDVTKDETLALIIVGKHSDEMTETDVSDLRRQFMDTPEAERAQPRS
jgi:hypothetical protein